MTSSARWFLLFLLAFLGARKMFSSTRTCFSLPALLLGILSLFASAQAQAQITVWSDTLTVPDTSSSINNGCDNAYTAAIEKCSMPATLTEDEVAIGGQDCQIVRIKNQTSRFCFSFNVNPNNSLKALNICVGTTSLPISDAQSGDRHTVESRSPGFVIFPG